MAFPTEKQVQSAVRKTLFESLAESGDYGTMIGKHLVEFAISKSQVVSVSVEDPGSEKYEEYSYRLVLEPVNIEHR